MKLGLCSVTFRDKTPEQVVDLVAEAGLEAIEWGGDVHVPPGDYNKAEVVASLTKSRGLEVSSYGSYYRLADHTDNEFAFPAILKTAKYLETNAIRVWAGSKGSDDATSDYRKKVAEDARIIGDLAAQEGISVHLEYHGGTLTDTKESARQLMEEISHDNVFLYWQPSNDVSVEERLASIDYVENWITNIHIFHWYSYQDRMSLAEGAEDWKQYLSSIQEDNKERYVLIEFVKGDSEEQFYQDAQTLKELKESIVNKAT
ncbi:sugar phosphate isomerase/epimerase [Gracilibacillus oryzae]|uniref:Sugar phosphate isomerase/epimerase n=1 Tax=Gracilibacillus oryzae TaxID=1672701 RepID=A0A7C8KTC4_9BACI|nr:sugar phosphate isomerase/epimerase [Gracilibacillus oryzae]KAB8139389.1 sugar phosphate isomerase/epimerase [Gracilibacillus oryzae]